MDDFNFLAANAVLAGVTAGVAAKLRGSSFSDAFARGAAGGATMYLGKRIVAARFGGAGWIGREIGAIGASMGRNAADGVPLLDSLVLPVGPLWLFASPSDWHTVRVAVDLQATGWLLRALAEPRLHFDVGESLSMGSPVFRTNSRVRAGGEGGTGGEVAGLIILSRWTTGDPKRTLAHEQVHVLQSDFMKIAWGMPIEDWVRRAVGADGWLFDHIVIGIAQEPFNYLLTAPWNRTSNLLEVEADFLEAR